MIWKRNLCAALLPLLILSGCAQGGEPAKASPLPAPEKEGGLRGEQFGIDKNINEGTIDQYLGREDTVYRDMRMLKDEANYEAIGGDSWLSGIVEGFEVVPYPYLVNVEGLPEEVGSSYQGNTLFTHDANGYTANYEQSMAVLEYLFPKDKNIILMCGGGGYAGMTKNMLAELGWDADRIWNAGGYWFYSGEHSMNVKREENGKTYYDFYKLPYHYLDFDSMERITAPAAAPSETPAAPSQAAFDPGLEPLDADGLQKLIEEKKTFAVSVYLPSCPSCAAVAPVVREVADSKQIPFYQISLSEIKDTENVITEAVKYTPSVVIFKDGELTAFLDSSKDEDFEPFTKAEALSKWMAKYVDMETVVGTETVQKEDCGNACSAFGDLTGQESGAN